MHKTKCPYCNSEIKVQDNQDTIECPACGSKFSNLESTKASEEHKQQVQSVVNDLYEALEKGAQAEFEEENLDADIEEINLIDDEDWMTSKPADKKSKPVGTKGDGYDIFICCKEKDIHGNKTQDLQVAKKIYSAFLKEGYKVFLVDETLGGKIPSNSELESIIDKSRLMICVTSKYGNLEATWVKNQWTHFLEVKKNDKTKDLITVFDAMVADQLPRVLKDKIKYFWENGRGLPAVLSFGKKFIK